MVFINHYTRNFLFLSLLLSIYLLDVGAINSTYNFHFCTNTANTNSDKNSIYRSNLNTLLSSLSSNATSRKFHNASSGGVYGLFYCRGDVNTTTCGDCVTFAAKDVVERCPTGELAVLWYEECLLRYSNASFFGKVATRPGAYLWNTANVTDRERFNRLLDTTMKEAAAEAARGGSGVKKFTTRDANFNGFQRLYTLVQCTPDLSAEDCGRCLANATGRLPICCDGKLGGRVLLPSCNIRYDFYPFYDVQAVSSMPTTSVLSTVYTTSAVPPSTSTVPAVYRTSPVPPLTSIVLTEYRTVYPTGAVPPSTSTVPTVYPTSAAPPTRSTVPTAYVAAPPTRSTVPTAYVVAPPTRSTVPTAYVYPTTYPTISVPPANMIPPAPSPKGKNKVSSAIIIVACVVSVVATVLLVTTGYYFRMRARKKHNALIAEENALNDMTVESLQYDFKSIETATSNFSDYNVLGEGGFGKVYKGKLQDGREIAVKRLSKSSGQGALEFKNEVVLVAKLQHRNLVRLLGFCLERDEKILVYEYVPNKSLDYFLFDAEKKCQMKWSIRANVIEGIVRGILYLHEDSRLKIIHRDLKAGNILLDKNMNPKVSDFGMAKMFGEDEPQGSTRRVVGTYGYMAPEYAMEGLYSVKSDVYSFGVLLLEILSGRRNSSFHATDCAPSLVAYVWQLWNEGKALDMVDQCLRDSSHPNEFLRYIQIGLLCVQEDALLRPTMSSVALMLKSEAQSLSQPERPAFITTRYTSHQEILVVNGGSVNEITVSEFFPR